MRVLHLTRDLPSESLVLGGISTAVAGLVGALQGIGISSSVLSFDGWRPKGKRPPGPDPQEMLSQGRPCLRLSHPAHLPAAEAFAKAQSPHLVHVHHDMLWPLGRDLANLMGIPALVSIHVAQGIQNEIRGVQEVTQSLRAQELAIEEAAAILAPSPDVLQWLKRTYPHSSPYVRFTPLGLAAPKNLPEVGRARLPSNPPTVLYVGRFSDIKGTDVLIEAALGVLKADSRVRFHLAGGSPMSPKIDKRWRERWASLAPEGLRERLHFLGWLEQDRLREELESATMLIAPSRYETFGFATLEALFYHLPVIASDVGGLRWMIHPGETGILIPPGDPLALEESILKGLKNPQRAEVMAYKGQQDAHHRFEWKRVVSAHSATYWRALKKRL